jgi:hypothetical protein
VQYNAAVFFVVSLPISCHNLGVYRQTEKGTPVLMWSSELPAYNYLYVYLYVCFKSRYILLHSIHFGHVAIEQ